MLTHSRNPKTPQIHSFFYEKWLLFGVFAGQLDKNPPTSKLVSDFVSIRPWYHIMKLLRCISPYEGSTLMITPEEMIAAIQKLRPIDDVLFEVLVRNKGVCQEILRTILSDNVLVVEDIITQASERNLYSRSVVLDALCTFGNGCKCNIEVQRSDNDDHVKRVRFNASSITVRESNPGEHFSDIIELYVVYISIISEKCYY